MVPRPNAMTKSIIKAVEKGKPNLYISRNMADKIQPMSERSSRKAGLQEGAIRPKRVGILNSQIVASVWKRCLMDGFSQGVCGTPARCVEYC